jgi:hypothetical protein
MLEAVTGPYVEASPDHCPNGHRLGAGQVLVGWMPCDCTGGGDPKGHRTWTCQRCDETIYASEHTFT